MWTDDHIRALIGDAPEWQQRAQCQGTDGEAFFPEKGGSTREAKRICSRCEVRKECLEYALEHGIGHGIWGGLTEKERRKVKRAGGAVSALPTPAPVPEGRAA